MGWVRFWFGDDSYDDVDDDDWDQLNINLGWKFWSGNPTGPPWTNRGHTLLAVPSTFSPSLTGVFIWYLVFGNNKYQIPSLPLSAPPSQVSDQSEI